MYRLMKQTPIAAVVVEPPVTGLRNQIYR
jgi:hypothetical protein